MMKNSKKEKIELYHGRTKAYEWECDNIYTGTVKVPKKKNEKRKKQKK